MQLRNGNFILRILGEKILPEEQKRCRKGRYGTKDQLLIDKGVLKNWRKRQKSGDRLD